VSVAAGCMTTWVRSLIPLEVEKSAHRQGGGDGNNHTMLRLISCVMAAIMEKSATPSACVEKEEPVARDETYLHVEISERTKQERSCLRGY